MAPGSGDVVDYRPAIPSQNMDSRSRDVVDYRPAIPSQNESSESHQKSSSRNPFADRQKLVRQLCDASLLAANVSQLRAVLDGNSAEYIYFWPLIVMIGLSILLHIGFGFIMILRWKKERDAEMEHNRNNGLCPDTPTSDSSLLPKRAEGTMCFCRQCSIVEKCDEISMFIMLFIVVLNVGIAGLGLSGPKKC